MAVRESAAIGVGRQRAADASRAAGNEGSAFALLAEAERLDREQHHRRERVVDLAAVDVVGRDARAFEREPPATRGGRFREVFPLAHRGMARRFAGPEHPDWLLGAVAGPLLAGEHDRAAAVT